jgi:hypothetical protein
MEVLNWWRKEYPALDAFVECLGVGGGWHNGDVPGCLARQITDAAKALSCAFDDYGAVSVYYESRLEGRAAGSYYVFVWRVTPTSGTMVPLVRQMQVQYPRGDARAVWDATTDGTAAVFTYRW